MELTAVDLFCGAGGLTCGLIKSGISVAAGIDFDENCRFAYEYNNKSRFIHKKIEDACSQDIESYWKDSDIKILVGCAPCQPFSSHTNKIKQKDDRWFLLDHFSRLIKETTPDIVSMENVPQLAKQEIFDDFVNTLGQLGYSVSWKIVFCPDYGVPQNRYRLVLLASLKGSITLIEPTHTDKKDMTVKSAIGHLPKLNSGEIDNIDLLHRSPRLTGINYKRMTQSKPGGTWRDWDPELVLECHKKESGSTYASVYGRMVWDEPSPTITTQFYNYGTGRFGHPEQNRALSLREGAILQTFPHDYNFIEHNEDYSFKVIGKMIGNAVPVRLGEIIGISIKQHLQTEGFDMSEQGHKYTMSINLNVLNHLGINLYSNIPSVLSEIVANSWDADAQKVNITFKNNEIEIIDDGIGMTEEDINQKFLMVGYPKRESGTTRSEIFHRPFMGRKGIGKLSMFSIAKQIDVITCRNSIINGFRMNVDDITAAINDNSIGSDYHPTVLLPEGLSMDHDGTKIILRSLKKNISSLTPNYLRKRISRRFSIIGSDYNFQVLVNGDPVTVEDRDYYHKLNYIWCYGEESRIYSSYSKNTTHDELRPNIISCGENEYLISGWIGTVEMSGSLKDGDDNLNKIVILVRGKLGQENILDEYTEGGLYSKYLIGEIHADFFEDDLYEDMATSSRQEYKRDDERFIALKDFIYSELKYIQNKWTSLRNESGVEKAITLLPVMKNWYGTLEGDDKQYAQKMMGKINQIIIEEDKKSEILKYSILAFEKLRYVKQLSAIERITPESLTALREVLNGVDELEATQYYQIIKQRTEVIKHFRGLTTDDEKEKVIQEYLFNHLWLLDPAWERVEGTEYMEKSVLNALDAVYNKLSDDEKKARLDIGYRLTAGKHVVIELKRDKRVVSIGELIQQTSKYSKALRKVLAEAGHGSNSFEIICVLGKPLDNDDSLESREQVKESLATWNARVVFYSELIENAYRAYSEYLKISEKNQPLVEMFTQLDVNFDA